MLSVRFACVQLRTVSKRSFSCTTRVLSEKKETDEINKINYTRPFTNSTAEYYIPDKEADVSPIEPIKQENEESNSGDDFDHKEEVYEKFSKISNGLAAAAIAFAGYEVYQNFDYFRYLFFRKDYGIDDSKIVVPTTFKRSSIEVPILTNDNTSDRPGLYLCGRNEEGLINERKDKTIGFPLRFGFFDGFLIKDVKISRQSGAVVDDNGDLFQWTSDSAPCKTIQGENLSKVELSNNLAYLLTKKGEVLYLPETPIDDFVPYKSVGLFSQSTKNYNKLAIPLERGESIQDISAGKEHLLLLTTKGRCLTCATGVKPIEKSTGQFGIPTLSQFDKAPEPNKVYDITLLNNVKVKVDNKITMKPRIISQIAAGDFHSLALDKNGIVWSWGKNNNGQLGQNVTYDTEVQPIPKGIDSFGKHFKRSQYPYATRIDAGGDSSFATIRVKDMHHDFFENNEIDVNKNNSDLDTNKDHLFAWGNGLEGQLGVGYYTHSRSEPLKMKELMSMKEFNETTNTVATVPVKSWSIGSSHVAVVLDNSANKSERTNDDKNDVLIWGSNEHSQLGTGKKVKAGLPMKIPQLLEPTQKKSVEELREVNNNRLQLYDSKPMVFKNNDGKTIRAMVEQVIFAGDDVTAVFYRRV